MEAQNISLLTPLTEESHLLRYLGPTYQKKNWIINEMHASGVLRLLAPHHGAMVALMPNILESMLICSVSAKIKEQKSFI